ncbi:MAG: hypothetical protein AAFQ91_32320 [Cyanobacteria bacterium J06621_15]
MKANGAANLFLINPNGIVFDVNCVIKMCLIFRINSKLFKTMK